MYVGGRPNSILKIAGAKVKVQWEILCLNQRVRISEASVNGLKIELDESYKKCQRLMIIWAQHAGDQMVAQGAGVRSARGALDASWIMSDGGARQPRIMYDGGPGMQSHHTHRNFLFGMVHLPPSGGTRWMII
ncbi:hypothetical protein B0H17DRAFT_1136509 [Mycena rosella]|uniref:Uncharacterized protein n=1 Tax=Mycena rosella TaxID=1033263 RepID=A0AAD7DAN1_MYCRO|nr:hypothetical protein B0H17DRAFT_1136509 [Mycena rosella]